MKKIVYDKLKLNQKKDEDEVILVKSRYDENTGEKVEEVETMIDIDLIPDRILALQSEIDVLTEIQNRVQNNDFDISENKGDG